MDAVAAAPRVSAPLLIVSAADDPVTEETRAVAAAAHARLDIIPGTGSHGVALLDPAAEPKAAQVSALVEGFLRQYAG